MKPYFAFLLVMFFWQTTHAQKKFESEVRIKKQEVPEEAISYVDQFGFKSKIKWYQEFGLTDSSYEAKTKSNGLVYSIEFNSKGVFEDVEITIDTKDIPQKTLEEINSRFKVDLKKFRIRKVQLQYSGEKNAVVQKVVKNKEDDQLIVRYEIVVSAKVKKKFQKFEYLFSNSGQYIEHSIIVLVNTDNLEY